MTTATAKRTWTGIDDEILNQRVYWYGEYRAFTHIDGHAIMVFSERVPVDPFPGARRKVQHTVQLRWGPYGESGHEETLPLGTKLTDAKRRAIELAREVNRDDGGQFELA